MINTNSDFDVFVKARQMNKQRTLLSIQIINLVIVLNQHKLYVFIYNTVIKQSIQAQYMHRKSHSNKKNKGLSSWRADYASSVGRSVGSVTGSARSVAWHWTW